MHLRNLIQQRPDEEIIEVLRRHPLVYIPAIFLFLLMQLLPIGVYLFFQNVMPEMLANQMSRAVFYLVASLFMLSGWLQLFAQFVDYYLDVWILTTKRIVNIEQNGLFGRIVAELELTQVQDVTSEVNGFLPSMFQYGFVYIQTAGEKMRFVFEQIPHPHHVRKTVIELTEKAKK